MTTELQARQSRTLLSLLDIFPAEDLDRRNVKIVGADEVPRPYSDILVHRHHMTVTLEQVHGAKVHLVVLDRRQEDGAYARKLLLTAGPKGKVIMAGIMRFHLLEFCPSIRRQVVEERSPLGRILIECEVMRHIEPRAYLRVRLSPAVRDLFRAGDDAEVTYGRTAVISCEGKPAVDLVEIVAPDPPTGMKRPIPAFRGERGCPSGRCGGKDGR